METFGEASKKRLPDESGLLRWLGVLAKAKWLITQKLVYQLLRVLRAVGQRSGDVFAG